MLVGALALGGGVVAALTFFDDFVRERVLQEARARGVLLDRVGTVSVWFGSASLADVAFRLEGVPSLSGSVEQIDVVLADWTPKRLNAERVRISVVGSAADLALQLAGWTARHPQAYALPVSARGVDLAWRSGPTDDPWLVLQGGSMVEAPPSVLFSAAGARVYGVDIGSVGASWSKREDSIVMGFGDADPDQAALRLEVRHTLGQPEASVRLKRTPLEQLAGPLGVALPVEGVSVEGTAELRFPGVTKPGPISGTLDILLPGFIPPHPLELNGFLFGEGTRFKTDFTVGADRRRVELTSSEVTAGAFRLKGDGLIQRMEDYAALQMSLSGSLSCAAVADSAAKARLGSVLGRLLGSAARQVLEGSVRVRVQILGDTRNLDAAKVTRQIGVGCGLKPLGSAELEKLGVPKELAKIADELPSLPKDLPRSPEDLLKALPPIPSALPPLPKLKIPGGIPDIPFPKKNDRQLQPETDTTP